MKKADSIFWSPELTEEAEEMSVRFLAELFAPIIRDRLIYRGDTDA